MTSHEAKEDLIIIITMMMKMRRKMMVIMMLQDVLLKLSNVKRFVGFFKNTFLFLLLLLVFGITI
jgi:hypothetical protein